jgi:hypothetical protein
MSWSSTMTAVESPTAAFASPVMNNSVTSDLQHRQISSTTTQRRVIRHPDHYEMIDQIGKGKTMSQMAKGLMKKLSMIKPLIGANGKLSKACN